MNRTTDSDAHAFDAQARQLHRASLEQLSPRTLARLRAARAQARAPRPRRAWPWLAATACSGVLAAVIGLQWSGAGDTGSPPAMVASQSAQAGVTERGAADLLDENPELYLWLASAEAPPLAME